jgi:CubicO group peptidase (beta-lactamase class C family)
MAMKAGVASRGWRAAVLALVALLLGIAATRPVAANGPDAGLPESPLRLSETVEVVVADLESFVPEYMRAEEVPGAVVALIRDGKVVWTEGYGVANAITDNPVTPDTLFEVASNSKVVTAYVALRLVDQGVLSLDEPLNAYLPEPWLPPSEYRDAVTLRHVLSHTSGLGHATPNRDLLFVPGNGYSYSALGYLYLQEVIEAVTGRSLDAVADEMVFEPLGMSSSSFINKAETADRMANGHTRAAVPVLLFLILLVASATVVCLVGLAMVRVSTGRWRPTRRMVLGATVGALLLASLAALLLLHGIDWPELGWLTVLCGWALALAFGLAMWAGRKVLSRLLPERRGVRRALTLVWSAVVLVGLVALVLSVPNVPVPKGLPIEAGAAGTVRATAGDLALFLIELADPQHLSNGLAAEMQSSQMALSHDLSWGLGPGIQHSVEGDALWQWGQAPDFQSVMIVYPERGAGVVVVTNNDWFNPDVAIAIAHRALGGKIEPLRRATHLAFNYRGPFLEEAR